MTKICTHCKLEKPLNDFGPSNDRKSGLKSHCKVCCNKRAAERLKANPKQHEKKKAQGLARYHELAKNPEYRKQKLTRQRETTYRRFKTNQCGHCSFIALDPCQLDVDHIDGNHSNNDPNNLQTLCANCHRLKTKLNRDGVFKLQLVRSA